LTQIVLYGTLLDYHLHKKNSVQTVKDTKNSLFKTLFVLLYVVILIIGYGTLYYYCRCCEISTFI
jgi:hypothetical protein